MKTRQQAAREYADKACDTTPRKNDGYPLTRTLGELKDDAIQDFLSGCEHADKESRDFYLLVRELFQLYDSRYSETKGDPFTAAAKAEKIKVRIIMLEKEIEKHLAAFTEREQQSLPFS